MLYIAIDTNIFIILESFKKKVEFHGVNVSLSIRRGNEILKNS